jgi:uncharacterized protein with PIN domain
MQANVTFRFYAELNDFLPVERRFKEILYSFNDHPAVKDSIEALGVPHTEVEVILVNGVSVGFDYQLKDGDRVSVYPVFESLDVTPLLRLRPEPLRVTRFVLDAHLGKLAAYLRLLGFDSLYRNDYDDYELARISAEERRILLTRDRGLLKRSQVTHGYCVRSTDSRKQVREVLRRFDLFTALAPFTRCLRCNGLLEPVSKEEVFDSLKQETRKYFEEFFRCKECGQVYWKGSHWERMQMFVKELMSREKLSSEP